MSLYHIVFLWLLLCTVVEHAKRRTPKGLFVLTFVLVSVFVCLRFGQGTDYFNYASIYRSMSPNFIEAINNPHHTEPGWNILNAIFQAVKAPYPVFVSCLSVYMMVMLYRFTRRYGEQRKFLALFLFFHTLILSYVMSILRQAVVITTFLGLLLPWLEKKQYYKYYFAAAILSTMHGVGLLLFLLPIVSSIRFRFKHLVAIVIIGFLAGSILSFVNIGVLLSKIVSSTYLKQTSISTFAVIERLATFMIVTLCYYLYQAGEEPSQEDFLMRIFKIYAFGLFFYGMLMWSPLISSRISYILKVVEVCLLCGTIIKCKKSALLIFLYCIVLSSVMYVKNIDSYLHQGQYQNATLINYPYVTVFDQEAILNYREDTVNYPFK